MQFAIFFILFAGACVALPEPGLLGLDLPLLGGGEDCKDAKNACSEKSMQKFIKELKSIVKASLKKSESRRNFVFPFILVFVFICQLIILVYFSFIHSNELEAMLQNFVQSCFKTCPRWKEMRWISTCR